MYKEVKTVYSSQPTNNFKGSFKKEGKDKKDK